MTNVSEATVLELGSVGFHLKNGQWCICVNYLRPTVLPRGFNSAEEKAKHFLKVS